MNRFSFKKIINPYDNSESYDTIGMVDAVFKVITSELYELFKYSISLVGFKRLYKNLRFPIGVTQLFNRLLTQEYLPEKRLS